MDDATLNYTLREVPLSLPTGDRIAASVSLQSWLSDLIDLSLRLKQAHWNLRGPRFLSIHEQLDEILVDVRAAVDQVAERIVMLGSPADGRATEIAASSRLENYPSNTLSVEDTIALCVRDTSRASVLGRQALDAVGDIDPISEDLIISIVASLEKHGWMLDAQRPIAIT